MGMVYNRAAADPWAERLGIATISCRLFVTAGHGKVTAEDHLWRKTVNHWPFVNYIRQR